jgi:hypothetical protein
VSAVGGAIRRALHLVERILAPPARTTGRRRLLERPVYWIGTGPSPFTTEAAAEIRELEKP